jgi:hypothetical protein
MTSTSRIQDNFVNSHGTYWMVVHAVKQAQAQAQAQAEAIWFAKWNGPIQFWPAHLPTSASMTLSIAHVAKQLPR